NNNLMLFVGAGVSKNLNLPDWSDLINHLADELGYNKDIFHTMGDYQSLAEYYIIQKNGIGELRSWMDLNWHRDMEKKLKKSRIYELITKLNFPIIYTTNYDNSIEMAHKYYKKDFVKVASVKDIRCIDNNKKQIIKFHGDFSDDNSIVLTESSYFDRLDFDTPLDIKFRSDVLGKSILFIGYSLSDINIRFIFYKLTKIWEESGQIKNRPPVFIFTNKENPIQEAVLKKRGIEMIVSDVDDRAKALEDFLSGLIDKNGSF
ncbi:MAG: Sir2 family NAD-dependent protein deacetylase, partial [Epsilonproteobacteria bacterium]